MKKLLMVAAAAAAMSAVPASAQSLTYNLSAQVATVCGVYKFDGPTVPVDFGALATTPTATAVAVGAGSATYRCNAPAGFSRTIDSVNDGFLVRTGAPVINAENRILFEMSHGGGSGLGFATQQLTGPLTSSLGGSSAFLAGQTGSINFRTFGVQAAPGGNEAPGTTVFAGTYTDTVTITVTAN